MNQSISEEKGLFTLKKENCFCCCDFPGKSCSERENRAF